MGEHLSDFGDHGVGKHVADGARDHFGDLLPVLVAAHLDDHVAALAARLLDVDRAADNHEAAVR